MDNDRTLALWVLPNGQLPHGASLSAMAKPSSIRFQAHLRSYQSDTPEPGICLARDMDFTSNSLVKDVHAAVFVSYRALSS